MENELRAVAAVDEERIALEARSLLKRMARDKVPVGVAS